MCVENKNDYLMVNFKSVSYTHLDVYKRQVYVKSRDVYYDKEVYTVQIQSKVNQTMVIQDQSSNTEVQLNIGDQYRNMETNYGTIVIDPLATQTFQMEFTKFFDDGRTSSGLRLTDIRIYNQYTGQESDNQEDVYKRQQLDRVA